MASDWRGAIGRFAAFAAPANSWRSAPCTVERARFMMHHVEPHERHARARSL
jgi:hypothetical protein